MRYWTIVLAMLAITAAVLPLGRVVDTVLADAQIVFVLALLALLVRLAWAAARPHSVTEFGGGASAPPPPPEDVPTPD